MLLSRLIDLSEAGKFVLVGMRPGTIMGLTEDGNYKIQFTDGNIDDVDPASVFPAQRIEDIDNTGSMGDHPELQSDVTDADELQIRVHDSWATVDKNTFRSWTGQRLKNGEPYAGPVYYYLSNDLAPRADDIP